MLQSVGSQRVGHHLVTEQQQQQLLSTKLRIFENHVKLRLFVSQKIKFITAGGSQRHIAK